MWLSFRSMPKLAVRRKILPSPLDWYSVFFFFVPLSRALTSTLYGASNHRGSESTSIAGILHNKEQVAGMQSGSGMEILVALSHCAHILDKGMKKPLAEFWQ